MPSFGPFKHKGSVFSPNRGQKSHVADKKLAHCSTMKWTDQLSPDHSGKTSALQLNTNDQRRVETAMGKRHANNSSFRTSINDPSTTKKNPKIQVQGSAFEKPNKYTMLKKNFIVN